MFGSVLAGYTIIDFKKEFLRSMIHPKNQFVIGLLLGMSFVDYDSSWKIILVEIVVISLIFTLSLQGLKKIIGKVKT